VYQPALSKFVILCYHARELASSTAASGHLISLPSPRCVSHGETRALGVLTKSIVPFHVLMTDKILLTSMLLSLTPGHCFRTQDTDMSVCLT